MSDFRSTAVFRVDASSRIGGGHVIRSLALADTLAGKGWYCTIAIRPETLETVPALARCGHRLMVLPADGDAEEIGQALEGNVHWLIVDHYGLDERFHCACRRWAERICVIDDLADRRYDCDVLVDPTPGRTAEIYKDRVPEACHILPGPEYALLRPEFADQRRRVLSRGKDGPCRRVLVSLGLTDPDGHTLTALEGLRRAGVQVPVDVMLGRASPCRDAVLRMAEALPFPVTVHDEQADMAAIMAAADLAIGAGGGTALERCCLGLPSIVIVAADNQAAVAATLAEAGAIELPGSGDAVTEVKLAAAVRELCGDPERMASKSAAAAAICDGQGARRVGEVLDR